MSDQKHAEGAGDIAIGQAVIDEQPLLNQNVNQP